MNAAVTKENVLGMDLEVWRWKSCRAEFGVESDWATLYLIQSQQESQGHATELLTEAKAHYEGMGKKFGGSIALNQRMRKIYQRLGIEEYT